MLEDVDLFLRESAAAIKQRSFGLFVSAGELVWRIRAQVFSAYLGV